jgi:hypothetical protein
MAPELEIFCVEVLVSRQVEKEPVKAQLSEVKQGPEIPAQRGFQYVRIDAAAKQLYPPDGRPPDDIGNAALTRRVGAELNSESKRLGTKNPGPDAVRRWRRARFKD